MFNRDELDQIHLKIKTLTSEITRLHDILGRTGLVKYTYNLQAFGTRTSDVTNIANKIDMLEEFLGVEAVKLPASEQYQLKEALDE